MTMFNKTSSPSPSPAHESTESKLGDEKANIANFLKNASIEVTPKGLEKIENIAVKLQLQLD